MNNLLTEDIKFLAGVGPKKAELLNKELNIYTFEDLAFYFPYKYLDRSKFYKIEEINGDLPYIQLIGKITDVEIVGERNKKRLVAYFSDQTGSIELVWFKGIKWVAESIKPNVEYVVFGKPSEFNKKLNIAHPELELLEMAAI